MSGMATSSFIFGSREAWKNIHTQKRGIDVDCGMMHFKYLWFLMYVAEEEGTQT